MTEEEKRIKARVQQAMRSRVQHFRDLADSLTFEGARRLLEKDLDLDTYALDKYKKFVKELLEKILSGTEDDDMESEQIKSYKIKKEEEKQPKEQKVTTDDDNDEEKIEDSPVMGLLSGNKSSKSENPKIPSEDMIKEAISKRATYFRSKSEELTVAGVRRLIEEDLELEKFSLDPFKKLISKQLDEVLNSQNDNTPNKADDDSSHSESEDKEVEVKPKKKPAPKTKIQKSEEPKKRKKPVQETEQPKKKKMKSTEETSVKKKIVKDADQDSSGEKSDSSAEKSEKKEKEVVAPVYGKKVERLKSVIKACGMSVAPTVYRKAKQVSEDKREAFLLKELKEILSKEGLSANPSEKEIKEVKRKKERAKELEGIDTSNIVMGSRRRSTFNFVAPPKPKAPIDDESEESDDDDGDDSEDTDNEDGDGDGDDKDGNDEDGDDKEGDDQEADDKDDDGKDDDDDDDDDDGKDGDDHDDDVGGKDEEDDKVHDSKSEEVTGNDEIV